MTKKQITIAVLILAAAAVAFYFYSKSKKEKEAEIKKTEESIDANPETKVKTQQDAARLGVSYEQRRRTIATKLVNLN
jgi:flagellar basal body-associated protein FliL